MAADVDAPQQRDVKAHHRTPDAVVSAARRGSRRALARSRRGPLSSPPSLWSIVGREPAAGVQLADEAQVYHVGGAGGAGLGQVRVVQDRLDALLGEPGCPDVAVQLVCLLGVGS